MENPGAFLIETDREKALRRGHPNSHLLGRGRVGLDDAAGAHAAQFLVLVAITAKLAMHVPR
jgi:hypothetical protein